MATGRPARQRRAWVKGSLIPLLFVLVVAACTTGPGEASETTESPPLPPGSEPEPPDASSVVPPERQTPLRYPRLLDDPEGSTAGTQSGSPAEVADNPRAATARIAPLPPPGDLQRTDLSTTNPLVEDLLASLSLRQRIGQRFIAHIPGDRITYGAGRAIAEVAPAGFIVYPWNFSDAAELRSLTASLQRFARAITPGIELIICTDQEGGRVATLRAPEFFQTPAARIVGEMAGPVELAAAETGRPQAGPIEAAAYLTGMQLQAVGINMNLAPVLDAFDGDSETVIGDRSYSGDPAVVSGIVAPYLRGANRSGIISVAKHFPGHGLTTVDSHNELPIVEVSRRELLDDDLLPFRTAIDQGIEVIMTAHILFRSIDPFYPVTMSRMFLKNILRREMGFRGVVMSDGLEMGAIRDNYELEETLVHLFRNDVDLILLFVNYDVVELVDTVEELVRRGEISEADINRGVRRVLALKLKYGLAHPEGL